MLALRRNLDAVFINMRESIERGVFILVGKLIFHLNRFSYLKSMRIVDENGNFAVCRLFLVGAEREERTNLDIAQLFESVPRNTERIFLYGGNGGAGRIS